MDKVPWARMWAGREDMPGLLREIATAPAHVATSPVWRLWHGLFSDLSDAEVYAAAPHLVPYLLELARIARRPHRELGPRPDDRHRGRPVLQ
ncbi:hypothetical protein ACBI99_42880 [Nonomuraea sp. ATR24]|uniref:hypothetical protein n=1 Tax=Nonomuraea sp. ATR24 TaxID=1676744 RepID=UPI0035BF98DE